MAAITISGVSHEFRNAGRPVEALRHVGLDVPAGQVVAVIGPNGSGKSTLLRVIAGLLPPTAGTVHIDGRAVEGPDPAIGLVFQEPRLLPWRDAESNVSFPLELAGWDPGRRLARARELLGMLGVDDFATSRPHQLSGGMRQRVAIARSLALAPSALLLDEPFSALDALTRDRLNMELLTLWERTHATIVIVTHSIPEAVFLADRVIVLSPRPGHVVADIAVPFPRPRRVSDMDAASVSSTAAEVRAHLVAGDELAPPAAVANGPHALAPRTAATEVRT